ncbi:MAG TPA: HAD-IIB family hydrolase, partial [Thermoprotei archaeon]|nr:HAD-IIB family hydrolase [Thermoprotei archaeon]
PDEQKILAEELSRRKLSVNITSSGYAVHIMPSGINKGKGLKMLCDRMGIDYKETAVIGDSYNDLDMFSIAGISISLPNAPEEVRRSADIVAGGPGYGYSLAIALKIVRRFIL